MFLCNDILVALLAERCDLYEQLGLLDIHAADPQGSTALGALVDHAVTMSQPMEALEWQIADINRRIARLRGPISDGLAFDLN